MRPFKTYTTSLTVYTLAAFVLSACTDVVDIPLEQEGERLVVQGGIHKVVENDNHVHRITLATTFDFYSTEDPPPVQGAIVYVEDSQGQRYVFDEVRNSRGVYENATLEGQVGETYTLTIEAKGDVYKAEGKMHAVSGIDAIYSTFQEETVFADEGFRTNIDFQDPEDEKNYYLFEYYIDGEIEIRPDPGNETNLLLKDDFFNGQAVTGFQPNEDAAVQAGQRVLIRQFGISKDAYDYYFTLYDQTGKVGFFFDTPPAPVFGNIRNTTNPEHYPLGYFLVAEVSEKQLDL